MTENEERLEELKDAVCILVCIAEDAVCRKGFEELDNAGAEIIGCLEEIQQYRAIGTIEELQELKEKNEPKKVKKSGVMDSDGVFHATNGINGVPYDLCPNCEINLCTDGMFGENTRGMKYCKNCGQKIDWSE